MKILSSGSEKVSRDMFLSDHCLYRRHFYVTISGFRLEHWYLLVDLHNYADASSPSSLLMCDTRASGVALVFYVSYMNSYHVTAKYSCVNQSAGVKVTELAPASPVRAVSEMNNKVT